MMVNGGSLSVARRTLGDNGEKSLIEARNALLITLVILTGVGSTGSQTTCCRIETVLSRNTADIPLSFLISFHQPEGSHSFNCLTLES